MSLGHVAVITGASSGIGRATAEEFARKGYALAVIARREDLLITLIKELRELSPHGKFLAFPCDISNWKEVTEVAAKIATAFPHINILINNAGAFEYQSLEKSTPEKLDEMINVNIRGVLYMSKAYLPHMKRAVQAGGRAKIVNVSSISGLWGFSNMSAYTATKFAVAGFSSALRRELNPEHIQVATIFPGPVNTRLPKGKRPEKRMVMIPEDIARQIFTLATSSKKNQIMHPVFMALHVLESLSPKMVDKVLKKIL